MERLNNIMGRATQRRHNYSEQRPSLQARPVQQQPTVPQGPQGTDGADTRPPLREQNARQGQQRSYVPPTQHTTQGQPMPSPRIKQEQTGYEDRASGQHGQAPITRQIPIPPRPQQNQSQRSVSSRPLAYQPTRPERQPAQSQPINHPLQTRPVHVYHRADEYPRSPVVQADVVEDRDDEEEEEAGMQYGDWEEAESEVVIYQRPVAEPKAPAHGAFTPRDDYKQPPYAPQQEYPQHPLVTRELTRPAHTGTPTYQTRTLREVRDSQPPTPQTHVQEVQHHRTTQPLAPRTITEAGREHYAAQQRPLRPAQQVVQPKSQVREQSVMPYTTSTQLPQVAPFATTKSVCPRCKGAGYLRSNVPFGHPNFGKPMACECKEAEKKEKRRQQLLELSDLGAYRAKSLTNFSTHFPGVHPATQEAFEVAQDYAQDPYGWLLLVGPNGCGKTHLAAAIANKCLDSGSVVLFAVVPDLLAHLRSTFAPTAPEGYDKLFAKMREAELLVLDDLGSHQSSPWASEKLFQLLNYRYNSQYPTVITANKGGLGSVDDRILSRLSDVGLVNSVVMDGAQDYRRRNPRRN